MKLFLNEPYLIPKYFEGYFNSFKIKALFSSLLKLFLAFFNLTYGLFISGFGFYIKSFFGGVSTF